VKSVAEAMRLDFRRIQFTPDLVPSDITGSEVIGGGRAAPGRAPSASSRARCSPTWCSPTRSTGAAAHPGGAARGDAGARGERRGAHDAAPEPFFVLATQNPIEQEGTYPLPEAQLDRFLFDVRVG
jgi:MoxR-like ATPase